MILLWTLLGLLVLLGLVLEALRRERIHSLNLSLVVVRQRREIGRLQAVLEAVGEELCAMKRKVGVHEAVLEAVGEHFGLGGE